MSFWSYMGHRLLGGALGILGFGLTVVSLASNHLFLAFIGILFLVAACYFFKTQH